MEDLIGEDCAAAVVTALESVEGVASAELDRLTRVATVDGVAPISALVAAVAAAGMGASVAGEGTLLESRAGPPFGHPVGHSTSKIYVDTVRQRVYEMEPGERVDFAVAVRAAGGATFASGTAADWLMDSD
eukprot:COSAG01_NODE_21526_length_898_cov_0.966208_2_plen_131_part_00